MLLASLLLALLPQDSAPWRDELAAARALSLPALVDADLARWSAWIRPAPAELAFEELDWIPTFAGGLRAAERAARPLLFWAMNGHPLGCT